VVSREFHNQYPSIPIFTIHDALYTYEEYIPELTRLILERFHEITGVKPGVKVKNEYRNPGPHKKDLEKEWSKIKKITTLKKYQKISGGVFKSNLDRASEFLKNWPEFFPVNDGNYED
jgi:hypothetical protein